MNSTYPILRSYRQNLSVATVFWGTCLALVLAEVALGSNIVIGGLFVLSIPLLVAVLTWVNKGIVFDRVPRTVGSVVVLGLSVFARLHGDHSRRPAGGRQSQSPHDSRVGSLMPGAAGNGVQHDR